MAQRCYRMHHEHHDNSIQGNLCKWMYVKGGMRKLYNCIVNNRLGSLILLTDLGLNWDTKALERLKAHCIAAHPTQTQTHQQLPGLCLFLRGRFFSLGFVGPQLHASKLRSERQTFQFACLETDLRPRPISRGSSVLVQYRISAPALYFPHLFSFLNVFPHAKAVFLRFCCSVVANAVAQLEYGLESQEALPQRKVTIATCRIMLPIANPSLKP